jgi:hypothetical protein
MPIDFARVPPKVAVPELPRLSLTVWACLFVLVTSGGAGFAIYTLPPGTSSDTAWFWICVAVFPVLAWTFLLFARLTFLHVQRATAIATNRVSDRELDKCHARASEPLALIGHAWIFSGVDEENEASEITDGAVQLKPRPSLASSNSDVTARWIDIPGRSFNAGNAFSERKRHKEIIEWLLERLVTRLAPQLRKLPSSTSLRVTLSLSAHVDEKLAGQRLAIMLADLHLSIDVTVDATNEKVSLFEVDSWLDDITDRTVHLLVALQLRNAISNLLEKRMAEAAVALLWDIRHSRRRLPMGRQCAYIVPKGGQAKRLTKSWPAQRAGGSPPCQKLIRRGHATCRRIPICLFDHRNTSIHVRVCATSMRRSATAVTPISG